MTALERAIAVATSNGIPFEVTVTMIDGQTFRGETGMSGELWVPDELLDTRHIFLNHDRIAHVEVHYMPD